MTINQTKNPALYLWIISISLLIMAVAGFGGVAILNNLLVASQEQSSQATQLLLFQAIQVWLLVFITDALVSWGLYQWLKKLNQQWALISTLLRLVYTVILGYALSYLVLAWLDWGQIESREMLIQWIQLPVAAFQKAWSGGLIIFGGHLLALGYLCSQHQGIPRMLVFLITLAGLGYVVLHTMPLVGAGFGEYKMWLEIFFIPAMILGELGLAIWILIRRKQLIAAY